MDALEKIKDIDFNPYIKTELFLLLFINLIAPFLAEGVLGSLPFISFFEYDAHINLNIILSIITAIFILIANTNRIKYAYAYRKTYISLTILNVLAFIFAGGLTLATSISTLHITLKNYYEITLGDGYNATPY